MDKATIERLRKVLIEHSVDSVENTAFHSWRCRYPDRYGPCTCFEELMVDLTRALASQDDSVRVPREPTQEMLEAAQDCNEGEDDPLAAFTRIYKAMLSAAPGEEMK